MSAANAIPPTTDPHLARDTFSLLPPAMAILATIAAVLGDGFMGPARFAAMAALALQVAVELRQGRNRFLTSPLFLLAALTMTFFSFIQGFWGKSVFGFMTNDFTTYRLPPSRDFTVYVGGTAEQLVIAFAMACLVCYFFASRTEDENSAGIIDLPGGNVRIETIFLIVFTFSISLLNCTLYAIRVSNDGSFPVSVQIGFITPPLVAVALICLARCAKGRGRRYTVAFAATAVAGLSALAYAREGKLVIFIAGALALYVIRLYKPAASRVLLAGAMVPVAGLVFLLITLEVRSPESSVISKFALGGQEVNWRFQELVGWKVVWRQTETGFCLGNVMTAHMDAPFEPSRQLFWLKGLVPRVMWPEKPNLSHGRDYAVLYCYKPPETVGVHSASITLLGQPVIHGGWIGLLIHGGFLLFALAAIERINRDPHTLAAAAASALLPWLMDFDQDFVLYVANAVKFGLVMAVVIVPVGVIEKRRLSVPK